ncbi:MAG TPA: putative aminohydrolase SsnA [Anaerolineae bacterium]|nr:MAG: 8-oxoguanine deaminase [Chloroflexi bacterium ADurb.Bin222]HOS79490.1 putative aminohydrolase SsnA [Anaerolineae bacterium]HQJ10639.1 putative aminohydrolase SsnA [Anaerolineae bacterium]
MLITNARIATLGPEPRLIEDGALYLDGDKIVAVDTTAALRARYPEAECFDAGGQLALPAPLCGHTHFYGAFARGWAYPGPAATRFGEILERLWWRLDKLLTPEDVRYSALVCLADAIRHGTTTLIDHHASPFAIPGSLDIIAEEVLRSGLRASLCYEVTDRDGEALAQAGLAENVRFLRRMQAQPHPQLAASFGLHASLTLSEATLAAAVAAAEGLETGFHIHAAEGIEDVEDSLRKSGRRVIHRLHAAGILGPRSIVAHAVHVDESEMEVLADTGTWVTHQPRSNMNNAVGVGRVERLLAHGVKVALGNDGFSNNMFAEMKAAYLVHKLAQQDPRAMPGDLVFRLAFDANAQLARLFWPQATLGVLEPGATADLILVDYHPITPLNAGNLPWHFLFGYEASMITTTISAGRVLMRDRQVLTLDEEEITARSRELAAKLWQRAL